MYFMNLWKSDNPVSSVCVFINDLGQLVRIRSIHDGFSGFLKHVGLFTKSCKDYLSQKVPIADSDNAELKSPTIRKFSYFVI